MQTDRRRPADWVVSTIPATRSKPKPAKVPRTPPVVDFLRKTIERALRPVAQLADVTDQKARFQELIGEVR